MSDIDVFNGDADGICALHQLRLSDPRPDAKLITGVKRDIQLLANVQNARDSNITVLDISLDRNREPLEILLGNNNTILYTDHHYSGHIPSSAYLKVHIDPSPQTCTSLIVDAFLNGKYKPWAVVGAFGDNLDEAAIQAAKSIDLAPSDIDNLKETGILLNYNGYGASLGDLFFTPDELYIQVHRYLDPLAFHAESATLQTLREGYAHDMDLAMKHTPVTESPFGRIFELPADSWARRVAGVYSNTLARERPEMAHGLVIVNSDATYRISVRAPLNNRTGADELCRQFPTGGGRAAAAGINNLPADQLDRFHQEFMKQFNKQSTH